MGKTPAEVVKCKAKAVRVIYIYQFKFSEFTQNYAQWFFQEVWSMVLGSQVQASKQNERLIHAVMRYLTEMIFNFSYHEFFKSNLATLFQLIIVPNISITEDDTEEYEVEPESYIRNDLEESDTDTRRRQCMKFL